jgi:hypothetical protein
MDSKALLVVLVLFVLAIGVWAIVSKRSEKFNDNSNNGNGCGSSMRYSSPMRNRKNYGNEYNEYLSNGYWNWQSPEEKWLGCLNGFLVNCGTGRQCYNEAVKSCKGV